MPTRASVSSKKSKALIPGKFLLPIFLGILVVVGLIAALILSTTNQDNRQKAYVAAPPAPQKGCYKINTNGTCSSTSVASTSPCPGGYVQGSCPLVQCCVGGQNRTCAGTCGGCNGTSGSCSTYVAVNCCRGGQNMVCDRDCRNCQGGPATNGLCNSGSQPAPIGTGNGNGNSPSCAKMAANSLCFNDDKYVGSFECNKCKYCASGTYRIEVVGTAKVEKCN